VDRFVVTGPTPLEGEIAVGGAKNAVLPLMAAALLARGETVIDNVPDLVDVPDMEHPDRLLIEGGFGVPLMQHLSSSDVHFTSTPEGTTVDLELHR